MVKFNYTHTTEDVDLKNRNQLISHPKNEEMEAICRNANNNFEGLKCEDHPELLTTLSYYHETNKKKIDFKIENACCTKFKNYLEERFR